MRVMRMPRVPRERSRAQVKAIAAIEAFDLTDIRRALTARGWGEAEADEAIRWYRRFLILRVLYPERQIVPSHAVDEVWHLHILETRRYAADCDRIFGAFLHHEPNPQPGEGISRGMVEGFVEAQELAKLEFGEAPPVLQGRALCVSGRPLLER